MSFVESRADAQNHMPTLDGLRGFAALIVAVTHLNTAFDHYFFQSFHDIGSIGVLLFFSLSGFLIGTLYLGKPFTYDNTVKYSVSRIARIVPAYYIAILLCWVLYLAIPDFEYQLPPVMLIRSLAFTGNVGIFWSIPPEIQFYGFFIAVWFCAEKFKAGKYALPATLAVIMLALIATREMWGGLSLPSKLHIFLFGMLAAVLMRDERCKKVLGSVFFQAAIALICALYVCFLLTEGTIYSDILLAVIVALFIASFSVFTKISRIFAALPMRIIGFASFSIYLFHDPLLLVLNRYYPAEGAFTMVDMFVISTLSLVPPLLFHFAAERTLTRAAKEKTLAFLDSERMLLLKQKLFGLKTA